MTRKIVVNSLPVDRAGPSHLYTVRPPPTSRWKPASMAMESNDDDRLFVRDGWRHYRRRYSSSEFRWGVVTFGVLGLITSWVVWKGERPDPALYSDGAALLRPGAAKAEPITVAVSPPKVSPAAAAASENSREAMPSLAHLAADRGPLPRNLAGPGWKEEKIAQFDEENLYVKIDGRADYFRAFHFNRLYSMVLINEKDAAITIDVEMYELSNPRQRPGRLRRRAAAGCEGPGHGGGPASLRAERPSMSRGPYYVRVIGSDETPLITEKLQKLATTLIAEVKGEPLPWAYGLFLGQMGFSADKITYSAKNAFSLGFANDVWAVRPKGKENDLEIFVSARQDAASARQLAERLQKAFLELGKPAGKAGGVALVKDQFLGLMSGATSIDQFVIGVRGAADKQAAVEEIERLRGAIKGAPAELRAQARPQAVEQTGAVSERKKTTTPASKRRTSMRSDSPSEPRRPQKTAPEPAPPPSPEDLAALADQAQAERRLFLRQAAVVGAATVGAGYVSLAPAGWPLSLRDPTASGASRCPPALRPARGRLRRRPLDRRCPTWGWPAATRSAPMVRGRRRRHRRHRPLRPARRRGGDQAERRLRARRRSLGATTHPEVLTALIHLVREAGAAEIRVADNPIESPQSCFHADRHPAGGGGGGRARLPALAPASSRRCNVPGATWIEKLAVLLAALQGRQQGHRRGPGQGPQPLPGLDDHQELVRPAGRAPQPVPPGHPRHHRRPGPDAAADLRAARRQPGAVPQRPHRRQPERRQGRAHHRRLDRLAGRRRLRLGQPARAQGRGAARLLRQAPPRASWAIPTGAAARSRRSRSDEAASSSTRAKLLKVVERNRDGTPWYARVLRITNWRIVSQVFFFALFVFLLWATWFSRLGGYPVSLFLEMDPLVTFATALSTHTVYRWLWRAMWILVPTLLLGGCSAAGSAPTAPSTSSSAGCSTSGSNRHNIDVNRYRPIFQLKYYRPRPSSWCWRRSARCRSGCSIRSACWCARSRWRVKPGVRRRPLAGGHRLPAPPSPGRHRPARLRGRLVRGPDAGGAGGDEPGHPALLLPGALPAGRLPGRAVAVRALADRPRRHQVHRLQPLPAPLRGGLRPAGGPAQERVLRLLQLHRRLPGGRAQLPLRAGADRTSGSSATSRTAPPRCSGAR